MSQAVESYSRAEAEKYIKDSSSAWAESVATNDASVVQRILADDFVWLREGKVLDKSRAVTVAQQGPADTWVRRGGIWQIVAAVDVSVPAAIKE